jgi:hypothetical protein
MNGRDGPVPHTGGFSRCAPFTAAAYIRAAA